MRTLDELINTEDSALPLVHQWVAAARCPVEILPCSPADGERALLATQVTTRSPMGAICHSTGGILVDDGWLRILGAGHPRLPRSLPAWNEGRSPLGPDGRPTVYWIADDVIGGIFAINGGGIEGVEPGKVAYLAPDTLAWESTKLGYSDFLTWSWSGRLDGYYESERWPGWREECRALGGDRAFSFYPFLWAGGPPIAERKRGTVPVAEAFSLILETRRQIGGGK